MSDFEKYFEYRNGHLYWTSEGAKKMRFKRAGCTKNGGYMGLKLNGKDYMVNRVVWELFNGPIPDGMQVIHINRNKSDNRIENLRLVTPGQSRRNTEAEQAARQRNRS